jgi:hypothetical protein
MASIVKMPGTPSAPKRTRAPRLDGHIKLDPDDLIIPLHVVKILNDGWNKPFPLSDLKPENCSVVDRTRAAKDRTRIVFENGQLFSVEPDRNLAADSTMNTTDFITAGRRFAKAALLHYEPKKDAPTLSEQLTTHFERIAGRPDFQTNFHRYRQYSEQLFEHWIAVPEFNIGDWQEELYQRIRDKDRDRMDTMRGLYGRDDGPSRRQQPRDDYTSGRQSFRDDQANGRHSFREDAPGSRNNGQQKPRENVEQRGQRKDGANYGRCIYCGVREVHSSWRCEEKTGRWCVRSPGTNKWRPPVADLQVCWNWNSLKGCDNSRCKFVHACTLCGSGAISNAAAAHNAQRCNSSN